MRKTEPTKNKTPSERCITGMNESPWERPSVISEMASMINSPEPMVKSQLAISSRFCMMVIRWVCADVSRHSYFTLKASLDTGSRLPLSHPLSIDLGHAKLFGDCLSRVAPSGSRNAGFSFVSRQSRVSVRQPKRLRQVGLRVCCNLLLIFPFALSVIGLPQQLFDH